jgi:hypothetical protein
MYPRGSAIAYSASNRVDDLALGIDRDFFRSLSRMAVQCRYGTATVRKRTGRKTASLPLRAPRLCVRMETVNPQFSEIGH